MKNQAVNQQNEEKISFCETSELMLVSLKIIKPKAALCEFTNKVVIVKDTYTANQNTTKF